MWLTLIMPSAGSRTVESPPAGIVPAVKALLANEGLMLTAMSEPSRVFKSLSHTLLATAMAMWVARGSGKAINGLSAVALQGHCDCVVSTTLPSLVLSVTCTVAFTVLASIVPESHGSTCQGQVSANCDGASYRRPLCSIVTVAAVTRTRGSIIAAHCCAECHCGASRVAAITSQRWVETGRCDDTVVFTPTNAPASSLVQDAATFHPLPSIDCVMAAVERPLGPTSSRYLLVPLEVETTQR